MVGWNLQSSGGGPPQERWTVLYLIVCRTWCAGTSLPTMGARLLPFWCQVYYSVSLLVNCVKTKSTNNNEIFY